MRFSWTKICERLRTFAIIIAAPVCAFSCYSPRASQDYFVRATASDTSLQPLYSTSLYTVYFDFALQRCVMHAAHTWGENGGSGGGTGLGITAFRCDPTRIQQRAIQHGLKVYKARFRATEASHEKKAKENPQVGPISKEGE